MTEAQKELLQGLKRIEVEAVREDRCHCGESAYAAGVMDGARKCLRYVQGWIARNGNDKT